MEPDSQATEAEKKRVYRRYCRGEATEEEVKEVFGEEFEEVRQRREFISVIKETPTNSASEDLFC